MDKGLHWPEKLEMLMPPMPWHRQKLRNTEGPLVVLLHGLWRSYRAMEPLARRLHREGFATLNIPYPSTKMPIPELSEIIKEVIIRESSERETYWITHSLGGILARSMMQSINLPKRLVMLAPSNQGSEIVDTLKNWPILGPCLGPAGRDLGSEGAPMWLPAPPESVETMVIMGRKKSIPLFRGLLEKDNDGIVSVQKGQLERDHSFHVIDADHTFIQIHPETIRLCLNFLRGKQC